ncbi:MAG TPA: hypothetical protein VG650_10480 [Mycobacteriales bacterium]|nr:hypothetical protein [Mycobacteriales bacterium]
MIARPVPQRAIVLAALALATPVLAGCGIEAKDETSKEHSQIQAASNHIGAIRIRNAYITTLTGGAQQTATGASKSYLVVTLVNNGTRPDAFTGASTGLGVTTLNAGPSATVGTSGVPLPPGVPVQISTPEINPDAPTLTITGASPTVGTTQLVSFSFAKAGTTRQLAVPVVSPGRGLSPTQVIPTDQATFATPIE